MHNKFAIFDGGLLEIGSFNWSNNAEFHNFENVNFFAEPEPLAAFRSYFDFLYDQSQGFRSSDLGPEAYLPLREN